MAKVIAVGEGGRAQAPERSDLCRPVVELVLSYGWLDRKLLSPVCADAAQADFVRRALYRSARIYCSCGRPMCTYRHKNYPTEANPAGGCPRGGQRVGCTAGIVRWTDPADGRKKLRVQFQLFDKREAMREVVRRYGPDPNSWPYFSRRRQKKEAA